MPGNGEMAVILEVNRQATIRIIKIYLNNILILDNIYIIFMYNCVIIV